VVVKKWRKEEENKQTFRAVMAPSVGFLSTIARAENGKKLGKRGEAGGDGELAYRAQERTVVGIGEEVFLGIISESLFKGETFGVLMVDGAAFKVKSGLVAGVFVASEKIVKVVEDTGK
jgi:hypothetical protein